MTTIDREKLKKLQEREAKRFVAEHPRSAELYNRAQQPHLGGVPMNWMKKWAGEFPVFVTKAKGAHFTCADGKEYVDLCLGDTGAMTGHSPEIVAEALAKRVKEGITLMLPTEDAIFVGEDLKKRFGLPYWQFTLTATDANRFVIRIAREITQRAKILVFHYCYHGTVDESFASLRDGVVDPRRGNIRPPVNPAETTRGVDFNDLNDLAATLKHVKEQVEFVKLLPLAQCFPGGVAQHIRRAHLSSSVQHLGERAKSTSAAKSPRSGDESPAAADLELERFLRLFALNRGL